MSVGVKGFRVGSGPRGNYIHMGRGGLYYKASLGGARTTDSKASYPVSTPVQPASTSGSDLYARQQIETGNVLDMKSSNGSSVVEQINEKLALWLLWPWALVAGIFLTVLFLGNPNGQPLAIAMACLTAIATTVLARWDQTRRVVVLVYDLDEAAQATLKAFTEEFEKLATASRIWNIDTAQRTEDLKRNAGASRLIGRQPVTLTQSVPSVVKTNVSVPAIIGGRQNVYFFPDVALVTHGKAVGAISYEQLETYWNVTRFIEADGVPPDSVVVGHTWRFVNKNGGPDRRFNNNRQIPEVQYQQMGLRDPGGFQKILQISRVSDRSMFDAALRALSCKVQQLKQLASTSPQST